MKTTLSHSQAMDILLADEDADWTYDEADALVNYYEDYEDENIDEDMVEMDAIAIRCEWTAYKDIKEVKVNWDFIKDLDDLKDHTQVIEYDGGLLVAEF